VPLVPLAQRTNTASRPKIDLGSPCQTHAAVLGRVNRAAIPRLHAAARPDCIMVRKLAAGRPGGRPAQVMPFSG
jgi:hypothetical protein